MPLSFYFDQHVPFPIAVGLRRRGIDVLTCGEDGNSELDDPGLLRRSTELGRVFFSQDADLLEIAKAHLREGIPFSGLAYSHQLNITIGQAIRDLELLAQVVAFAEMQNKIEFLPFD
jgi:predicted nuclease of predicted toxin-antitoxin system